MTLSDLRQSPPDVQRALLILLDLDPQSITPDEFTEQWTRQVAPLLNATPTQRFYRTVSRIQQETGLDRQNAVDRARVLRPDLWSAMHASGQRHSESWGVWSP